MIIEKIVNKIRYTLSNDNLHVGDKVFPIGRGRCTDNGEWIFHELDFNHIMTDFPNDPHKILDLEYSEYKLHSVRTDHGYSPIESYYKVIRMEREVPKLLTFDWIEIQIPNKLKREDEFQRQIKWNIIPDKCNYLGKKYKILDIDLQGGYFTLCDLEAKRGDVQALTDIDMELCDPIL